MKSLLISLVLVVPVIANAASPLKLVSNRSYEKSIYDEAAKYSINNGVPLDEQTFSVSSNGHKLGVFIAGQGFSDRDTKICFVSWATKPDKVDILIPTIGKDDWEAELCNNTVAVGVLSDEKDPFVKIGVVYDAQSPNANPMESAIFSIDKSTKKMTLDKELTGKIGSEDVATFKELKDLYKNNH